MCSLQPVTRWVKSRIAPTLLGMTVCSGLLGRAMIVFQRCKVFAGALRWGIRISFLGLGYTMAAIMQTDRYRSLLWSDGRHLWIWIHEKAVDAMGYTGLLDYNFLQEFALSSVSFRHNYFDVRFTLRVFLPGSCGGGASDYRVCLLVLAVLALTHRAFIWS